LNKERKMSIEIKEVSKLYGTQLALDAMSFTINKGEVVGFLGPNGAGKSTLMKIICGYIPASSGQVLVNGLDVATETKAVQKQIGYLPEHNPLYNELYIKEFLEFAARIHGVRTNIKQRIADSIHLVGLENEQHKKIGALSKGYRQRVGLAHALIPEPEILILDEPTTGLDPNQILEIRDLIARLGKEKTVMLSTHIMQEVEAIAQRVVIINKGKLVANDSTSNIQQSSQNQVILVEFNKAVEASFFSELPQLSDSRKINEKQWVLMFQTDDDPRETIFSLAVKNSLAVLTLQKQDKSMEEVFHELTK
jgi:ABC-2 type transport system ATP-binding protein